MGKIEKWHFAAKPLQIFRQTFIEMFIKKSSVSHKILCPMLIFIGCHGNQNAKIEKIPKKKYLRNHMLRLCRNFDQISIYRFCGFFFNYPSMAT